MSEQEKQAGKQPLSEQLMRSAEKINHPLKCRFCGQLLGETHLPNCAIRPVITVVPMDCDPPMRAPWMGCRECGALLNQTHIPECEIADGQIVQVELKDCVEDSDGAALGTNADANAPLLSFRVRGLTLAPSEIATGLLDLPNGKYLYVVEDGKSFLQSAVNLNPIRDLLCWMIPMKYSDQISLGAQLMVGMPKGRYILEWNSASAALYNLPAPAQTKPGEPAEEPLTMHFEDAEFPVRVGQLHIHLTKEHEMARIGNRLIVRRVGRDDIERSISNEFSSDPIGMDKVLREVRRERQRQVVVEGFRRAHDDEHDAGELAAAAASYAVNAADQLHPQSQGDGAGVQPIMWPWSADWWKPKSAREDLIRSCALIVAEVERIDRKAAADAAHVAGQE